MKPTAATLPERELLARSLGLYERIRLACEHPSWFDPGEAEADAQLSSWRALLGLDRPAALDRRLASEGLDRATVRRALGRLTLPEEYPDPSWILTLREVLIEMGSRPVGTEPPPLELARARGELILQHYWEPWVRVAARRLAARVDRLWSELGPAVKLALEIDLLEDLAACGRSCLLHELGKDRSGLSSEELLSLVASSSPPRTIYASCLRRLLGAEAWSFLAEYPVVARQAAVRLELWVDRVAELLARLEADRSLLAERFAGGSELGPLVGIRPSLSDPHAGGRRVMLLELGRKLIYKPRSVAAEARWNELLRWRRQISPAPSLRALEVCERAGYGWLEVVEAQARPAAGEEDDCLESFGALLALCHLLHATDLHDENVLCAPGSPVLVDLETLLAPDAPTSPAAEEAGEVPDAGGWRWLAESVLRTGLLPTALDLTRDASPLGGRQQPGVPPRFAHLNTDGMMELAPGPGEEFALRRGASAGGEQREFPDDAWLSPEPVCRGFRRTYAFLEAHRDALRGDHGPLAGFRPLSVRLVLRATADYTRVLHQSRAPALMRSGLAHSFGIDRLSLGHAGPLLAAEHAALAEGDIPRFEADVDGTAVHASEAAGRVRVTDVVLRESSWSRLERRLASLSARDRERQVQCVAGAMPSAWTPGGPQPTDVDDGACREVGLQLIRRLAELAIEEGASRSWIGRATDPSHGQRLAPVGGSLYDGSAGIAIALAAAHSICGEPLLREAALGALEPARVRLRRDPGRLLREEGLGVFVGAGGWIYAFGLVSRLLDEPALLAELGPLLACLDRETIARDRERDLIGGAAGLLLALRALEDDPRFPGIVPLAAACADHLLRAASPQAHGLAWVPKGEERPLCGFSHGNAGFALALLEAARITGEPGYRSAALAALEWERSLRDDGRGNWPDLRGEAHAWEVAWCHGAPGIALSRIGLLQVEELPGAREDLMIALATTRAAGPRPVPGLCCGDAGILDILLEIGRVTGEAAILDEARARADALARQVRGEDGLRVELLARPGLMTGTAGIGYALLRVEAELPSVLSLS